MSPSRRSGARLLVALVLTLTAAVGPGASRSRAAGPQRVVSLVPAVTEMIFAVGEGARVVAVSSYDRFPPEVARLPKAGALLDPDVERILSLKPDLVIVYGSQAELRQRLDRLDIPYYAYEHRTLADVMTTIRSVAVRIGAGVRGDQVAGDLERGIAAVRSSVARFSRPRTLLVFERDPSSLRNMLASGGYGFMHDMLEAAGGTDVFADLKQPSVQTSTEVILARQPDVIVELHYGDRLDVPIGSLHMEAWNALGAVPAVKNGRVSALVGDEFVIPGPRVLAGIQRLARVLHPELR
jgi:iron complex transport system substrate-binding protein